MARCVSSVRCWRASSSLPHDPSSCSHHTISGGAVPGESSLVCCSSPSPSPSSLPLALARNALTASGRPRSLRRKAVRHFESMFCLILRQSCSVSPKWCIRWPAFVTVPTAINLPSCTLTQKADNQRNNKMKVKFAHNVCRRLGGDRAGVSHDDLDLRGLRWPACHGQIGSLTRSRPSSRECDSWRWCAADPYSNAQSQNRFDF